MLETRELVSQVGKVSPRSNSQVAQDVRDAYYGVSVTPNPIPTVLFNGIDNEVRFGRASSSEGVGGLSVPDTHISLLTRKHGPVGDATFNEGRWSGYNETKARIETVQRLDFIAFARANRPNFDTAPFDQSRTQTDRDALVATARSVMGFGASPVRALADAGSGISPGLNLGDLFGGNAQVIPGLSFADIFRKIPLDMAPERAPGKRAATPLIWNVRVAGIEWLADVLNGGAQSVSLPELISILTNNAPANPDVEPLSLGMEAVLHWSNDIFEPVPIGPVEFIPTTGTTIQIDAKSRIDLGVVSIPAGGSDIRFSPGQARISARAKLLKFSVKVFGAI